jgi:hypothetical protein
MLIARRQRARESKLSRRPDRSCSVGVAKPVSHVCASACSGVRRRAWSGLSSMQMKLFGVGCRTPKSDMWVWTGAAQVVL